MKLDGKIIRGKWNKNSYKIVGFLGEGGIGKVYKVLDMKTNLHYALKISEDLQSITKESNMLNKFLYLDFVPNTIELDDYEEEGNTYYFIVIEYINGENFKEHISKNKLDLREIIGVVIIIGEMIYKLHRKGYIFGDLKLENVMIDREKEKIKIIDMGGIVRIGDSIKEFTPLYDRGKWNMGLRRADTNYDLFSICMMFVNLVFRNEKELLNMTIDDIINELKRSKIDRELIGLIRKGLYQKQIKFDEFLFRLKKIYKTLRIKRKMRYNDRVNLGINIFFIGSALVFFIALIIVIKTIL